MFSADYYVLNFLGENILSVTAFYMILRGLAAQSKWTWDEKVVEIIGSAFDVFKPAMKRKPKEAVKPAPKPRKRKPRKPRTLPTIGTGGGGLKT